MAHQAFQETVGKVAATPGFMGNTSQSPSIWTTTVAKCLESSLGWTIFTIIVVFLYLSWLNPPFVQQSKENDDLTRAPPNYTTVAVISACSGAMVYFWSSIRCWVIG